jgi:single-stranded-DNA-specific exonuclease
MDMNALKNYAKGINEEESPIRRPIVAKVVGVTFEGRQELLAELTEDSIISLERDRRNTYDPFAVKVMAVFGTEISQIGFVPKAMAKKVSNHLDNGGDLDCALHKILGGNIVDYGEDYSKRLNYGLEILIGPKE